MLLVQHQVEDIQPRGTLHMLAECKLVQDQVANQDQPIAKFQLKDLLLVVV